MSISLLAMKMPFETRLSGSIRSHGLPVVTYGEQRKYHNFCTYCVQGLPNMAPDGFKIPFSDAHSRLLSRFTRGPFRYRRYADSRSNSARIGDGPRKTVDFLIEARRDCSACQPDGVKWLS
jgi:hypothetical protein